MFRFVSFCLLLLIVQQQAFGVDVQNSLFNLTSSDVGCFVNADYRCEDPMVDGKSSYPLMAWSAKSYKARLKLFSSKSGANDVQNSLASCISYSQLIKTECGIKDPVLYFRSSSAARPVTFVVTDEDVNLSKNSSLPSIFLDYFSDKLDSEKIVRIGVNQVNNGISLTADGVFKTA